MRMGRALLIGLAAVMKQAQRMSVTPPPKASRRCQRSDVVLTCSCMSRHNRNKWIIKSNHMQWLKHAVASTENENKFTNGYFASADLLCEKRARDALAPLSEKELELRSLCGRALALRVAPDEVWVARALGDGHLQPLEHLDGRAAARADAPDAQVVVRRASSASAACRHRHRSDREKRARGNSASLSRVRRKRHGFSRTRLILKPNRYRVAKIVFYSDEI